jgi:hypothetical protein
VKASQRELEENIQSKFMGSTSELEACIERFHTKMKEKEICCNDVSVYFSFNINCLKMPLLMCQHFS